MPPARTMTRHLLASLLLAGAQTAFAQGKTCDDLVLEIAAKIDASGVRGYELEIVPADMVSGDKVVGSCEMGRKKITYVRAATTPRPRVATAPAPAASQPPKKP
jgi:Protein of unknown function (DUF1161)